MFMTVRLVCASCLESVESSEDDWLLATRKCARCGSPMESGGLAPAVGVTSEHGPSDFSPVLSDAPTRDDSGCRPDDRIGRFVLRRRLGGGGYGDVHAAFDPTLEREVALKILKVTKLDAKATQRFLREARAAAKLNHPNIVVLHDAGQDDGRLWIAYQLIEGSPLSNVRDSRTLDLRRAVTLVRDIADALRHAHARGIFHRDIKPANVIIDEDGVAHLTDFGLARSIELESELTGEGTILGTPAYMSPEQAAGRGHLADGRSDIYSLGIILYELICGRRPLDFPSDTPFWKLEHRAPPPSPHSLDRAIPRSLDRICTKALALDAEHRYQEAGEFVRALDAWLASKPAPRPGRRKVVGLVALGLLAGLTMVVPGARVIVGDQGAEPSEGIVTARNDVQKPVPNVTSSSSAGGLQEIGVLVHKKNGTIHLRPKSCSTALQILGGNGSAFSSSEEAERAGYSKICEKCGSK